MTDPTTTMPGTDVTRPALDTNVPIGALCDILDAAIRATNNATHLAATIQIGFMDASADATEAHRLAGVLSDALMSAHQAGRDLWDVVHNLRTKHKLDADTTTTAVTLTVPTGSRVVRDDTGNLLATFTTKADATVYAALQRGAGRSVTVTPV